MELEYGGAAPRRTALLRTSEFGFNTFEISV